MFRTGKLLLLFAISLMNLAFAQDAMQPRLLLLPMAPMLGCGTDTVPTYPSVLAEAMRNASAFDVPQGLEWDALVSKNNLLTSPQAAQILQASVESQAHWTLMPKWVKVDSVTCAIQVDVLRATDLRMQQEWKGATFDSTFNSAYFSSLQSSLAQKWNATRRGRVQIESVPTGAVMVGLLTAPVNLPFFTDTLLAKDYAVKVSLAGYDTIAEVISVKAGELVAKRYELKRTKAWLDSVANAQKQAHRDSLIQNAQSTKVKELPALFARLMSIPLPSQGLPVAILPFVVNNSKEVQAKLGYDPGKMAAEYGVVHLRRDTRIRVVERAQLDIVLQEQDLAQSDMLASDTQAVKAGRLVAAKYLITGTVTIAGNDQVFFAKMVDAESGEIVSASTAIITSEKNEELFRIALGERASASSALFRSAIIPGWGQFYTNHSIQGWVCIGAATLAVGHVAWRALDYQKKEKEADKFRNLDQSTMIVGESGEEWVVRANQAMTDRNKASDALNLSFAVLGGVWVANMIDAYVLGYIESKAIRSQYFSVSPVVQEQKIAGLAMNVSF